MKKLLITIQKGGNATVEAFGYNGEGCKARVNQIAAILGATESEQPKPEYYEAETESENVTE